MIKDWFDSFVGNIKHRTTNPFFGTFIVVWFFRHWKLVFSLLNFDSDTKLGDKIKLIETEFSNEPFLFSLLMTTLWTFAALIVSYLLLNLSRLVINFFEKNVTPWVYEITDKSKIVMKKDYDILSSDYKALEDRLEKEREHRLRVQSERDQLEKQIEETLKADQNSSNTGVTEDDKIESFKRIDQNLADHGYLEDFEKYFDKIGTGQLINPPNKLLSHLVNIGLVEKNIISDGGGYRATYDFTSRGFEYKEYYINHYVIGKVASISDKDKAE